MPDFEGRVSVDGQPVSGTHAAFGMVFQEESTFPWRTVLDNVAFPLELAGIARHERHARARHFVALVGLDGFEQRYPAELSGGMRQRVSIARTLASEPRVLLMDEPFGALDEFTRNRLDSDLRRLWAARGFTVVFVTHRIYEAVFLSSRVIVMAARPGRVIADVPIDGPAERGEDFRVSAPFIEYCRVLSEHLGRANRGER
jgi:NitT/TauT family transport system ATP-binding protein